VSDDAPASVQALAADREVTTKPAKERTVAAPSGSTVPLPHARCKDANMFQLNPLMSLMSYG
jgi:hypothetical protein